jgi:single-strand DNA-binding protein
MTKKTIMIKLIVSGRVGNDAEVKNVGDNTVCSFSVAHTEKVYGPNPSEKVIWITCSIWGERGVKLAPHILKGTFVVVEGSGGVNAYLNKNTGAAEAVIRCMVNSLEFGGKPTAAGIPTAIIESNKGYANPLNNPAVQELQRELNLGGVTFEGVDGDLPF